jgi:hypothetical protein
VTVAYNPSPETKKILKEPDYIAFVSAYKAKQQTEEDDEL